MNKQLQFVNIIVILLNVCIKHLQADFSKLPIKEGRPLDQPLDCGEVDHCQEPILPSGQSKKICGTNGMTFKSFCIFLRAYCEEGNFQFMHFGECTASDKCIGVRKTSLKEAKVKSGVFIPSCLPDGTYNPVQCHSGTGYCWCSTASGEAVRDTAVLKKTPNCDNFTKIHSTNVTSSRPPIWFKGILLESTYLHLTSGHNFNILNKGSPHSGDWNDERKSVKNKIKGMRGCQSKKRDLFNENVLRSILKEFLRENSPGTLDVSLEVAAIKWKFDKLNTKKDEGLKRTEYRGIQKIIRRSFQPRKCAKKFPKLCDLDSDKVISLQEWIKCFIIKPKGGKERTNRNPKTKGIHSSKIEAGSYTLVSKNHRPCEYDRKQALETGNLNVYIPKCNKKGKFKPVQCYGINSTGEWYCFCVNTENGDMIENTSVKNDSPNCSVSWERCPPPLKELRFLEALLRYFVKYMKEVIQKKQSNSVDVVEENIIEYLFDHFDVDKNDVLDKKEKRQLRKAIKKKDRAVWICGRKIHKVCDINEDGFISRRELHLCVSPNYDRSKTNHFSTTGTKAGEEEKFKKVSGERNPFIEIIKSVGK